MSACYNTFGKLSYTATRDKDKAVFSVTKGYNKIIRHYPYLATEAYIDNGLILPEKLPEFTSFMQAAAYLKKNLEKLA